MSDALLGLLNSDIPFRDVRIASQRDDVDVGDIGAEYMAIRTPEGWVNTTTIVTRADFDNLASGLVSGSGGDESRTAFAGTGMKAIERSIWLLPDPKKNPPGWKPQRLRASIVSCDGGEKQVMVLRRFGVPPASMEAQGLPMQLDQLLKRSSGLILVVGPTGTGKTTTVASMVSQINQSSNKHIVSIEDPIEYVHVAGKSTLSAREVGVDVRSFADGVREALRMAPDVIVVGEIRDKETLEAATRASESGHLVLATMHAPSCGQALRRVVAMFGTDTTSVASFANNLIAVVAQRLLPAKESRSVETDGKGMLASFADAKSSMAVKSYVLAYEVAMGGTKLIESMTSSVGLQGFDKRLREGQVDKHSIPMFETLKRLVEKNIVDSSVAIAITESNDDAKILLGLGK